MMNSEPTVIDGSVVSFHYTLSLKDGEIIDSSEEMGPLVVLQGSGEIIPGLEEALYGMTVGQEKDVVVAPAAGYGERVDAAVEVVSRELFPPDMELLPGMELELYDPTSQEEFVAWVTEANDDNVVLDFNHPLAGEDLHFHVKVVELRPATADELAHGHVHANGHHHH